MVADAQAGIMKFRSRRPGTVANLMELFLLLAILAAAMGGGHGLG